MVDAESGDSAAGSATASASTSADGTTSDGGGSFDTEEDDATGASTDSATDSGSTGTGWETGTTGEPEPNGCFAGDQCCSVDTEWPALLQAHRVDLEVRVNGELYEGSVYDDADIYLVNTESGDRAHLGRVSDGELSGTVIAGTYQVSYEARDGADSIPRNAQAIVKEGLNVYGPTSDLVDIISLDVDLSLTFNGKAPEETPYDDGVISVSRDGDAGRTVIGKTSTKGGLKMKLIDGDYDVFYESENAGATMPHNTLALLGAAGLKKGAEGTEDEFMVAPSIDVPVAVLGGAIDFDGKKPPASPFDHGYIYLRDRKSESVTKIADTADGMILEVPVIATDDAEYDLFYGAETVGVEAPANRWGRLNTALILGSEEALTGADLTKLSEISLPTMTVEGTIKVDGMSKPVDPENRGELLVGDLEGDRGELGDISVGIQSKLLLGDYGVFFRHDVSDGGLPANTFGRVSGESVSADDKEPLEVNVKSTALSGTITIGGSTPPLSVYDDGEIYLRNAAGDRVFLSRTRSGVYSRRVVEGEYDVYYAVVNSQGGVPANGETLLHSGVVIGGDAQTIEIDVPYVDFGGWNLPLLPTESGKARYFLRTSGTDDEIFLGKAGEVGEARVLPGEYELVYRMETLGIDTPRNDGAVIGCYSITANMP